MADLKQKYTAVSLTSAVQYVPTDRYTMGAYHNDSSSYGQDFIFTLNATTVGIIPEVQSVGDATPTEVHKKKLQQTIFFLSCSHSNSVVNFSNLATN